MVKNQEQFSSISVTPDIYCPSINENGKYIDFIPNFKDGGYYCECGSRKNKIYNTKNSLKQHFKTLKHIEWLKTMNNNKVNYYKENIELKETIKSQQIILTQLSNELSKKTLDYENFIKNYESHSVKTANLVDLLDLN